MQRCSESIEITDVRRNIWFNIFQCELTLPTCALTSMIWEFNSENALNIVSRVLNLI